MTEKQNLRLCSPFKISELVVKEVMDASDEFKINYSPNKNSLNKLFEFLKEYSDRRVSIIWTDGIDVREAALITQVAPNAVHRIDGMMDYRKIDKIIKEKLPFYFGDNNPAQNWTQLESYAALGVTDVFIADDLTFVLPEVRNFCDKHNIKIRVVLDRVPASVTTSKKIPIYFPQDMNFMSVYYDIGEFATDDEHKLKVLYKVWFKDKQWFGDIREINPEVPFEFPAMAVPRRFVRFRSNCEQRCLKGGKCNECNLIPNIACNLVRLNTRIGVENDNN